MCQGRVDRDKWRGCDRPHTAPLTNLRPRPNLSSAVRSTLTAGPNLSGLDGSAISERRGQPGRPVASQTALRRVRVKILRRFTNVCPVCEGHKNPGRRCTSLSRRHVRRCTPMHAWDRRRRDLAGLGRHASWSYVLTFLQSSWHIY